MSTSYCRDSEGWGPTSDRRVDLTPCFESTILLTLPALLAILAFIHRMYTLVRTGQAHGLGRTNIIYWPCQLLMTAAAILLFVRAGLAGQEAIHSPAAVLASASVGAAWLLAVLLNYLEHKYEVRSSIPIFSFYFASVVVSAIIIRTLSELPNPTGTDAVLYYTYFALITLGLVVESWPRGGTKVQQRSNASPYEKANLFSRYWFSYLQHIISVGYKRPLQGSDVADMMPLRIKTRFSYSLLSTQWDEHVQKRRAKGKEPKLMPLVLKAYGSQWVPIMIYRVLASALTFVAPVLMNQLLSFSASYSTDAPSPVSLGIIVSFGMFFSTIASALLEGQFYQLIMNMGIEARTALISMIYRKALRLSPSARNEQSPGDIQNHMSVDAERWSEALSFLPMWFSIPFEICIALWLLYRQLGWAAIAGAGTIVVVTPIQAWIAAFFAKAKDEKLAAMDNRIRLLNEVLSGIKIVKLYGWESSFRAKVAVFRNRELAILRKIGVAFSFMTIMFSSMTLLMALVSFSIFASLGNGEINSQTIFVSITLFGILNRPIGMMSFITGETMGLMVATRRIQKYLLAEELSDDTIEHIDELPNDPSLPVLEIKDGVFAWDEDGPHVETEKQIKIREKKEARKAKQEAKEAKEAGLPAPVPGTPVERNYEPTLKDINLSVHRGHLTAVVGRVGQGKTSLFNAMIGDMYKRRGTVKINGRIAYAPQQPWIINATLKDNIVFGCTFDQERYDQIVFAAGLTPDFEMLPAADLTEIGERGINLSGGQKQRVSLARAAYQDADIYLLDDPLSAVDAHVDQHLWKHLIGPEGLLSSKTRLLVTHGIHHLYEVDQIVVIKDGVITETGRYQDLLDAKNAFYQLIEDYSVKQKQRDTDSESMNDSETVKGSDEQTEIAQAHALHDKAVETKVMDQKNDDNAELVEQEEMKVGSIHWHVYKVYAKAASYRNAIQVIFLFAVIQGCQIGTNTWLQNWVETVNHAPHGLGYYMGIYAILVVGYMVLTAWTSYTTMVSVGIRASEKLHNDLLKNVLRLPMSFFDTTPVGRVINRFSSDCFSIDEQIPWAFHDMFFCFMSVLGSLIVIAVTTPIFLAIVPPVFLVYVFVQSYYIASSRSFKRIESISKSPMYQHFSETLSGVSTIRAMRCNERFIVENASKCDLASNAHFVWAVGNRWLNARLEALGSIIVLAASLFAVLNRNSLNSSMVGLSLSYALNITQDITWLVKNFCELQNELVGVERVKEYSEKNQEAPNETDVVLPENWPSQGQIVFKNYSTRYRQGMDLVIKNVSFEVSAGEKVGIVGRTGAGKSSLTLALFRIIEAANSHWAKASHNGSDYDSDPSKLDALPAELEKVEVEEDGGSIEIDGVDISTIGLEHLRQHLAIIPQDPTLFVGTVRDNLDPFEKVQDAEIWEALERAHLKEYISSMPGGLSYEVTQNGENFSVGQRSLICLARALLRKTKILILDEATAAVDVETDELIQKTIRQEFKDRTILTIAHRIKTVMDSDKILVLEKGRVEEYESPVLLMQRKESLFYLLAEQAGEVAKL